MPNIQLSSDVVSCTWLHKHLNSEQLIVLNTSENPNRFKVEDCIPNSIIFDLKESFTDNEAKFPNTIPSKSQFETETRKLGINSNSVLVVYDDKGIYWSARVWWLFKSYGFKNIAVLNGGLPEWNTQSNPVSPIEDIEIKPGNFSAKFDSSKMLFHADILKASSDERIRIIDARSKERFNCTIPEPREGLRSGNIPNSENLPYTKLLNGNCLKSRDELMSIFNTFTMQEKPIVFYCGSGVTACILALAANLLGYKQVSVYDGSWTEYGTLTT